MELIAYVLMAAGAYVALITKNRGILYGWFILYASYSLIVRIMPPTLDMIVYSQTLAVSPPLLTLYTLREPIVWIGASLLHDLLNDRIVTFLAVDILTGLIVLRSMKTLDDGTGTMLFMAPTIMTSYVFLLGQQNVWRQHVAFALLLWAIASRSRDRHGAIVLFVLAFLAHNATALFFGYWFDAGRIRRPRYGPLLTLAAVISMGLTLPWLGKSSSATGINTELLYPLFAAGMILLLLYVNSGRFSAINAPGLMNFLAFVPAIGILASAQFERIAMMFLVLILLDVHSRHRSLRLGTAEVTHAIFAVLVIPVFLFRSALNMLLM